MDYHSISFDFFYYSDSTEKISRRKVHVRVHEKPLINHRLVIMYLMDIRCVCKNISYIGRKLIKSPICVGYMHAERFRSLHFHFRCLFILTIYVYLCCRNEKKGSEALQARFRFKKIIFF